MHIKHLLLGAGLCVSANSFADIAILDFVNSTNENVDFLSEQLATNLQDELKNLTNEHLVNRGNVRITTLRNDVPKDALYDEDAALFLGDLLGADKIITGNIFKKNNRYALEVTMYNNNLNQPFQGSEKAFIAKKDISSIYNKIDDIAIHLNQFSNGNTPQQHVTQTPQPTKAPTTPQQQMNQHSIHITFKTDDISIFTIDGLYAFPNEHGILQLLVNSGEHKVEAWTGFLNRKLVYSDVISLHHDQHYSGIWRNGKLHINKAQPIATPIPTLPPVVNDYYVMNEQQFSKALYDIQQFETDIGRYDKSITLFNNRELTSAQAKGLVDALRNDSLKLKLAKFLYGNTIDKDNYTIVLSSLQTGSSRRELLRYMTDNS